MNTSFEHPSLRMPVTPEQRERAEQWLQEAYADGRLSEAEFDSRIGRVLSAGTRRELNEAFYGLVPPPQTSGAQTFGSSWSAAAPPQRPMGVYQQSYVPAPADQSTGPGAIAHFLGLFTWILGPGLVYALSGPGTRTRREAAKAFNFQLIAGVAGILAAILSSVAPWDILDFLVPLMWVGWFVLTIVGGAKAAQGADWKNPVKSVIKLDVLPER
ncbi:putative Tic20 family protein [Friedmanniella endophytica]|uniref:Putative Tic20 family protein n=2 Tax=Microlunatus kandeliicorticis TaxID=1759536 RepID=A0A7W3P783_9ACTN|nr:putative Tic20 family protein [Microlunatus kandeliicorticis]